MCNKSSKMKLLNDGEYCGRKRKMLFKHELNGWESWKKIITSCEVFAPMIYSIFGKEGLPINTLKNFPIATNAVFRVDNYVIKIYAPDETGVNDTDNTEPIVYEYAYDLGLPVPKIMARGVYHDKYLFEYIIMEYVKGIPFDRACMTASIQEKQYYIRQLREILYQFNKPVYNLIPKMDLIGRAINNERWNGLSDSLVSELISRAQTLSYENLVLAHGDLSSSNLIIDSNNKLWVIDFGEAQLAPPYYELVSIIFILFKWDKILVKEFAAECDSEVFISRLIDVIAIHDFAGDILKTFFKDINVEPNSVSDISMLKKLLLKQLS